MVNKLLKHRDNPVPETKDRPVWVWNNTDILQIHGRWTMRPHTRTQVPEDLATFLLGDPSYFVDDALLNPGGIRSIPAATFGTAQHRKTEKSASLRNPSVRVIVPVHNCPDMLERCDDFLSKTQYAGDWHVVYADDGSTDEGVSSFIKSRGLKSIRSENTQGFAATVNAAATDSDDDYLVLFNQDCEARRPDWLQNLITWMEDNERCGVAGAKLIYPNGKIQHAGIDFAQGTTPNHRLRNAAQDNPGVTKHERVSAVTGAVMAIRMSVWRELNGLDEAYQFGFEDVDFCLRALMLAVETWYVPSAMVIHHEYGVRKSSADVLQQAQKREGDGSIVFHKRWDAFLLRQKGGEVAFVLAANRTGSERCREVWGMANHVILCGQKAVLYTYDGRQPDDPESSVFFETRKIADLKKVDTLVCTGWETMALCKGNAADRKVYVGNPDRKILERYLGSGVDHLAEWIVPTNGANIQAILGVVL